MRLLLDTHALLWFLQGDSQLSDTARKQIESSGAEALASFVSFWEIAIKVTLGKLTLPGEYEDLFPATVIKSGLGQIEIRMTHLHALRRLPVHHRDPFDRLLLAQAQAEGLTLVSCDPEFSAYGVPLLW
jgi:PIN domain nuclease of toxin-antitoxin system